MTQYNISERSDTIKSDDKLVFFLYLLMRDEITCGKMEEIVEYSQALSYEMAYSNGWLAQYAIDIADRLREAPSDENS